MACRFNVLKSIVQYCIRFNLKPLASVTFLFSCLFELRGVKSFVFLLISAYSTGVQPSLWLLPPLQERYSKQMRDASHFFFRIFLWESNYFSINRVKWLLGHLCYAKTEVRARQGRRKWLKNSSKMRVKGFCIC